MYTFHAVYLLNAVVDRRFFSVSVFVQSFIILHLFVCLSAKRNIDSSIEIDGFFSSASLHFIQF